MNREYAVYTEDAKIDGIYDNDQMDWFTDYKEAKDFAITKAKEEGTAVYLSEVDDGDFSDRPEVY
ncbi:hypothetical protein [Qiania dongpingensis]|uniref:DUF2188 domain-containing protein n=1 Tax=Qiania dongpingensis TaxID=2763669 RepID=A0A7G9G6X2_9FIRM|nr:hypothetical protein [Qiania dongpingensis]QNM06554.1 hypothetical protein H9Q78_05325 [Qiania dongpingensis]